jgi:hypothetical protein
VGVVDLLAGWDVGFRGEGGELSLSMRVVRAISGRRGQQKMRSEPVFGTGLEVLDMVTTRWRSLWWARE